MRHVQLKWSHPCGDERLDNAWQDSLYDLKFLEELCVTTGAISLSVCVSPSIGFAKDFQPIDSGPACFITICFIRQNPLFGTLKEVFCGLFFFGRSLELMTEQVFLFLECGVCLGRQGFLLSFSFCL